MYTRSLASERWRREQTGSAAARLPAWSAVELAAALAPM